MSLIDRLKKFNLEEEVVSDDDAEFKDFIFKSLSQKTAAIPVWYEYSKEQQINLIRNFLDNQLNAQYRGVIISEDEKLQIAEEFLLQAKGFGPLDFLLAKSFVNGVIVNSSGAVFIETDNGIKKAELELSQKEIYSLNGRFVCNSPVTTLKADNFVVTIISQPVSDCTLIIRKVCVTKEVISDMTKNCLITEEIEQFLEYILNSRKNIIISGAINCGKSNFLQILLNSVNDQKRCILFEECTTGSKKSNNIMRFNTSSLNTEDFENLLSASTKTMPDYVLTDINNTAQLNVFYEALTPDMKGIVTSLRGSDISDSLSKFISTSMTTRKLSEKQAKARLASQFDYIIHIEKTNDRKTRIKSIMEITSSKSSALMQNEIVKLEDNHYILDLPEIPVNLDQEISNKPSATFLERLSSFP